MVLVDEPPSLCDTKKELLKKAPKLKYALWWTDLKFYQLRLGLGFS